jgi:N-acetylglucosaminyl-diphospho-decaprenol L-rhamnosyltransferase
MRGNFPVVGRGLVGSLIMGLGGAAKLRRVAYRCSTCDGSQGSRVLARSKANQATDAAELNETRIAIVIVNFRTPELIRQCLASLKLERRLLPKLEVTVVDGGSGDGSVAKLEHSIASPDFHNWVSLLPLSVNGGFGWANNQAILRLLQSNSPPEFIHMLNPDTIVEEGSVARLAEYLMGHPRAAVVGSQLLEIDGSLSGSAFHFPSVRGEFARGARTGLLDALLKVPSVEIVASEARQVDWVTGASFMVRSEALREVGLFDEGFFLYHEEVELMWRLHRAGWGIAIEPRSRVRHVGGASTGVNGRQAEGELRRRRPAYWYRSRSRLFGLTRGVSGASLAYLLWFLGHFVWKLRTLIGLTKGDKGVARQFSDHVRYALPRRHDWSPAVRSWNDAPGLPAWMERDRS